MNNVAIIGAGAAGMCCSIMIKQRDPKMNVTVFEANDRVGKKLALTGNGRCNISNVNLNSNRFHGNAEFAMRIINGFNYENQKDFFALLGVPFVEEDGGKAYPMSFQASSVVDALRFEMEDLKVRLKLSEKVCSISKNGDSFTVETDKCSYTFNAIVIACGGKTYGKISSDSGYTLLRSLGHKIEPLFPAIVQIKTAPEICRQLKGVKINGAITVKTDSETATEKGEILFCDYGISGPPVLQLSRLANHKNSVAVIDMLPEINSKQLHDAVLYRLSKFQSRPLSELFTGFLNKRIGQVLIKSIGYNINQLCCEFKTSDLKKLICSLKSLELTIKGTTGFENAQVTSGGAQTTQFFDNCMSKKSKGLFAIGEVLNVDGDCGGFNLAFAWASAHAAANGIINLLSKE